MKDDSDSEKQQQIHHIKNLYAFNLFCQKRFDESMQVFAKLGTGNTQVWWRRRGKMGRSESGRGSLSSQLASARDKLLWGPRGHTLTAPSYLMWSRPLMQASSFPECFVLSIREGNSHSVQQRFAISWCSLNAGLDRSSWAKQWVTVESQGQPVLSPCC